MVPPTEAIIRVTADTMPGRSAPCTLSMYGAPMRRVGQFRPHLANRDHQFAPQRLQRLLDRLEVAGADDHHREVAAQQRHRGVLEVHTGAGQGLGDVGDDARAVRTDDGDCELTHGAEPTWPKVSARCYFGIWTAFKPSNTPSGPLSSAV